VLLACLTCAAIRPVAGCGNGEDAPDGQGGYNNTTDPTNGGAAFLGSAACGSCHPGFQDRQSLHAHSYTLTRVEGQPPAFPMTVERAGVPDPPAGFTWSDISYVIGGYRHLALFVDLDGFILTSGQTGADTQWVLEQPATATPAGFVAYLPEQDQPQPLEFEIFRFLTTGPQPVPDGGAVHEENRPGIGGTWVQAGVQCESCHGPGARHVADPAARDLYIDSAGITSCNPCHSLAYEGAATAIHADGGFILARQQAAEVRASGGHADFTCQTCHEPHGGVTYDRGQAIRNECSACHSSQNMARHEGRTFTLGDYSETLTCASCHLPRAVHAVSSRTVASVDEGIPQGAEGRIGDTRSHIVRINAAPDDYTAVFTADGQQVRLDDQGAAALTVDFVCLRCHHGQGNVFGLSVARAAEIAAQLHGPQ
jgi:hypothetical protein